MDKARVGQKEHLILETFHQMLKSRAIIDVGSVTISGDNQAQMVEHKAEFATDDPAPFN